MIRAKVNVNMLFLWFMAQLLIVSTFYMHVLRKQENDFRYVYPISSCIHQ